MAGKSGRALADPLLDGGSKSQNTPNITRYIERGEESVIGDQESSVCSEVHTLSRKLVAEAIGTYFLVATIGLSAGQGEPLAPLAIGTYHRLGLG